MAPILEEMERRVKEEVGRVDVQFPSYVDDLHCALYDKRATGEEEAKLLSPNRELSYPT